MVVNSQSNAKIEDHFTAYIDLLGFSQFNLQATDEEQTAVLNLLKAISSLRSEFHAKVEKRDDGATYTISPTVSAFSDHIIISYPLDTLSDHLKETDQNLNITAMIVLNSFSQYLSGIARAALQLGFLIRGAVTVGKLYHSQGIVFGPALIESYELEAETAIYPRVILSKTLAARQEWRRNFLVHADEDGVFSVDYIRDVILRAANPGESYSATTKAWFEQVNAIIDEKLALLEANGPLNALAKWAWFKQKLHKAIEALNPELRTAFGLHWPGDQSSVAGRDGAP